MMQLIADYEDAVNYIYGNGTGHWKITPDVVKGEGYWLYTYCDLDGKPEPRGGYKGGSWYAPLEGLNLLVCKPLPNTEGLSPVIYKIRKMEARFNRRANA